MTLGQLAVAPYPKSTLKLCYHIVETYHSLACKDHVLLPSFHFHSSFIRQLNSPQAGQRNNCWFKNHFIFPVLESNNVSNYKLETALFCMCFSVTFCGCQILFSLMLVFLVETQTDQAQKHILIIYSEEAAF